MYPNVTLLCNNVKKGICFINLSMSQNDWRVAIQVKECQSLIVVSRHGIHFSLGHNLRYGEISR
jgi:tRNA threonylcarbamoyladenosine modification (KEOPS) complex Cgi121 subunit